MPATTKRTTTKTTAAKSRVEIPSPQTTYAGNDFYRKVQEKAYELFVARGCDHGYDVEDWLAAEQIVKGE